MSLSKRPWKAVASGLAAVAAVTMLPAALTQPARAAVKEATSDACGALTAKPGGGTWACSFVDNFSGTSLDTTKWNYDDSKITGFYMDSTCFAGNQNFKLGGGVATLSLTRAPAGFQCQTPYGSTPASFIGSDITTWGNFSQTYGKFEARLRYPSYSGGGYHGGFWANPKDNAYGAWPNSGEIDIAEWWSSQPTHVYPSLHYKDETGADTGWNCIISDPSAFHTYGVQWSPGAMTFSYDGQVVFTRTKDQSTGWQTLDPFTKPFYLSLSWADGGQLALPDANTPIPGTMVVDYVKAWS